MENDNETVTIDHTIESVSEPVPSPEETKDCTVCGKMHLQYVEKLESIIGTIHNRELVCDCNDVKPIVAPPTKKKSSR